MSLAGKEKLYFLLDEIDGVSEITPKGYPLKIHATHNLNNKYTGDELDMLFTKLEKDEKVLKVIKAGNRIKEIGSRYGLNDYDDGYYHIKLLPFFDKYFLKIQNDPEYQKFTGKTPPSEQSNDDSVTNIKEEDVTDTPIKVVISDLNSIYREIDTEKDKSQFFVKIAHYGKYILENRSTVAVLSPLYKEAQEDAEPYLKSWKGFVKVWKEYASDILKIAEKAGIEDDPNSPLSNEISSIKSHLKDKETSVWETDIQYYFIPYQTLIWKFGELSKQDLLIPKHLKPVQPDNKEVVIYPLYNEARDKWDKFKVVREAKVWWAHYQICRLAAGVLDLKIGTEYFKRDNIVDVFYKFEFNELAKGNPRSNPIVLHSDKYSIWIKRLHEYVMPRLEELSTNQREQHTKISSATFADTATRRGMEKKWDVLQATWSIYESHSRPESIFVPVARLTIKERGVEMIDGIIEGLKKEGVFQKWERKDRHYSLELINHDVLPEIYQSVGDIYKKLAGEYQEEQKGYKQVLDLSPKMELRPAWQELSAPTTVQLTKESISSKDNKNPDYNAVSHTIIFREKEIPIPSSSNQDSLCRIIFKSKSSIKKEWNHDEVLEKWGGNYDGKEAWRKVYSAGREINKKVAIETGVKDLLLVKKLTTSLNPKYFN